jgi:nicotinamidase/pyrazinamidase
VHCVQNTPGAAFHAGLNLDRVARVFRKGTDPAIDSYSGFFDNGHRAATGLADFLRDWGVDEVHVCGLATDYCVKHTAQDAVGLGFQTALLEDASRGVELQPGDIQRAIAEMRQRGVKVLEHHGGA